MMKPSPWLLVWALMGLLGCSTYIKQPEVIHTGGRLPISNSAIQPLHIQFTGVTGFVIRYGNSVVFTDPFVSNPPLGRVVFGRIYPEVPNGVYTDADLANAKLVLISHAHYDHLMDLPSLLPRMDSNAIIAGSNTMKHIMVAAKPQQPLLALNNIVGTDSTLGQWVYSHDSTVRAMAFTSSHPPHFMGITLFAGPYTKDLKSIPTKSRQWKRGLPLSYIIDFMESGKPVYRIFSQSSSAHGRKGLFPQVLLQEKTVDIVLVSQAVKGKDTDYSELVMHHCKAPIVFLTHWENFFRPPSKPLKTVPKAKVEANYQYLQTIKDSATLLILPKPGSRYVVGQ